MKLKKNKKGGVFVKVGYAVLYKDGTLTISKKHTILQTPIYIDFGEFDDNKIPWYHEREFIKNVQIINPMKVTCLDYWFYHCTNLTTLIDFQNLDVSDCEEFSYLFCGCQSLKNILSLKNWNVSNGKEFSSMFNHCESLIDLSALSNWNMSNGKGLSSMFCDCNSLTDISALQNWNVSNGKFFSFMFCGCKSLINVSALQNWNMFNGETFYYLFCDCFNLKEIHLPNRLIFLTFTMFDGCNENLKIHWKNKIYTYKDLLEYKKF